jgi:hypothetical protein
MVEPVASAPCTTRIVVAALTAECAAEWVRVAGAFGPGAFLDVAPG